MTLYKPFKRVIQLAHMSVPPGIAPNRPWGQEWRRLPRGPFGSFSPRLGKRGLNGPRGNRRHSWPQGRLGANQGGPNVPVS